MRAGSASERPRSTQNGLHATARRRYGTRRPDHRKEAVFPEHVASGPRAKDLVYLRSVLVQRERPPLGRAAAFAWASRRSGDIIPRQRFRATVVGSAAACNEYTNRGSPACWTATRRLRAHGSTRGTKHTCARSVADRRVWLRSTLAVRASPRLPCQRASGRKSHAPAGKTRAHRPVRFPTACSPRKHAIGRPLLSAILLRKGCTKSARRRNVTGS